MQHLRVLIVDDSLTIRAMLEELIAREPGAKVVGAAADLATARAMIADLVPNVITLDLAMPGEDGWALLRELRGAAHAPVVVVSSHTRAGAQQSLDALALGAEDCFDKSRMVCEAQHLLRVLKRAARRRLGDRAAG